MRTNELNKIFVDKLVENYKYKPLSKENSIKAREFYKKLLPDNLHIEGANDKLYTLTGSLICSGYDRIVIGDYGAYIEFNYDQANHTDFIIPTDQEYRLKDEYYKNIKYIWASIDDGSDVKIYYQLRTVTYADYVPEKFYVSVFEAIPNL